MRPYLEVLFGNPHRPRRDGREADAAVETARAQFASVIDVASERLFFTSGATESVNWALKGAISAPGQTRRRLVTIATEHACVLDTAEWLRSIGADVRSEEHTSELQSLMRISYAVFCLKKKKTSNLSTNNE